VKTKILSAALSAGMTTGLLAATMTMTAAPAEAIIVYDPTNYSQNILTAARTLEQINNQIRMLQNQAQSLINEGKNLERIDFPELQALQQTIAQIDALMGQAQGIQFRVADLDQQFRAKFPANFDAALTNDAHVIAARDRLDTSMAAYKQTMSIQSQVIENISNDQASLVGIVARSQGAQGALQVSQATNQLLALVAKQQFQLQTLMAAQSRADAISQANRTQAQRDARSASTRFLGSGSAYTPR